MKKGHTQPRWKRCGQSRMLLKDREVDANRDKKRELSLLTFQGRESSPLCTTLYHTPSLRIKKSLAIVCDALCMSGVKGLLMISLVNVKWLHTSNVKGTYIAFPVSNCKHHYILNSTYYTSLCCWYLLLYSWFKITSHGWTMPLSPVVMSISSSPLALAPPSYRLHHMM